MGKTPKVDRRGDIAIVTPDGAMTGGDETLALERQISELAEEGNRKLVVDLSRVELMTSRSIGALVWAYTHYANREGQVKLCGLGRRLKNIFIWTQLLKVFENFETLDEAIASFGAPRS